MSRSQALEEPFQAELRARAKPGSRQGLPMRQGHLLPRLSPWRWGGVLGWELGAGVLTWLSSCLVCDFQQTRVLLVPQFASIK